MNIDLALQCEKLERCLQSGKRCGRLEGYFALPTSPHLLSPLRTGLEFSFCAENSCVLAERAAKSVTMVHAAKNDRIH